MENNEKKQFTKSQITTIVLVCVLAAVYFSIIILDVFNIIPNLLWAAHLCACLVWLIIGCAEWAKNRRQSIFNFVIAATFAVLCILELIELFV